MTQYVHVDLYEQSPTEHVAYIREFDIRLIAKTRAAVEYETFSTLEEREGLKRIVIVWNELD